MNNQLAMASHQHYKEMTLNEKMLFEGLLCTLILPSLCHQLFLSTPNILFMNELGTPQSKSRYWVGKKNVFVLCTMALVVLTCI